MKFSNYNFTQELLNGLESEGFTKPTDIQYKAIPSILKGEDVMAIAATGTGKTAAYAIPIIEKLVRHHEPYRGPRALVLAPTRELAVQIAEVFEKIGKQTDLLTVVLTGGVEQNSQVSKLNEQADIIVASPGRTFDLLAQKHFNLEAIKIFVLDESDRMMALGFMKDVQDIKKRLPRNHQTLFFSATINEILKKQAYSVVKNAIRIQVSPKNQVSKNVDHKVLFIKMDDKRYFLERLIRENPEKKLIVFVRTQVRAERVSKAMKRVGLDVETIHGGMEQQDRFAVIEKIKKDNQFVLVTTDVSARGIDIKNVSFVINYDMPDEPENYIHRLGRTGRGVLKGYAVSFCSDEEKKQLVEIEKYLDKAIEIQKIEKGDYDSVIDFSEETKFNKKDIADLLKSEESAKKKRKNRKK